MKMLLVNRQINEVKSQYLQYGNQVYPVLFLLKHHLKTVRRQPHQKVVNGRRRAVAHQLKLAVIKLFLLGLELVFYRRHPASSGICRQSLDLLET